MLGQSPDSIGTVLCIDDEEGIIRIGFTGASRGWQADPADFQRLQEFKVGDWIRVRYTLPAAKHGFGDVTPGSIGVVYGIRPDSSLLIEFCYVPSPWLCEPEEIEPVVPFKASASFSLFCYGLYLNRALSLLSLVNLMCLLPCRLETKYVLNALYLNLDSLGMVRHIIVLEKLVKLKVMVS